MYLCYMKLEGYNDYEIYPETGQVYSYKRKKFIGHKGTRGYYDVLLTNDNGIKRLTRLHRIIWECVNGEIPDGMQINHIDENKDNNCISNLNLMTCKENNNWGTRNERAAKARINHPLRSKMVLGLKENKIMYLFPSTAEAERRQIFKGRGISRCARGERKVYNGYQWKYLDDYLGDLLEQIQDEDTALEKAS